MSESSLAALLSLKESAATIKCIAKQTRTVTNYPKESEGVERPFCHCTVIVQALIIHLAEDSPGRWGIPVLSNQALAQGQCGRVLSDPVETQLAARKSMQVRGCCSWIKVLWEEASPFHLQGWSRVVLFAISLFLTMQTVASRCCLLKMLRIQIQTCTKIPSHKVPGWEGQLQMKIVLVLVMPFSPLQCSWSCSVVTKISFKAKTNKGHSRNIYVSVIYTCHFSIYILKVSILGTKRC